MKSTFLTFILLCLCVSWTLNASSKDSSSKYEETKPHFDGETNPHSGVVAEVTILYEEDDVPPPPSDGILRTRKRSDSFSLIDEPATDFDEKDSTAEYKKLEELLEEFDFGVVMVQASSLRKQSKSLKPRSRRNSSFDAIPEENENETEDA